MEFHSISLPIGLKKLEGSGYSGYFNSSIQLLLSMKSVRDWLKCYDGPCEVSKQLKYISLYTDSILCRPNQLLNSIVDAPGFESGRDMLLQMIHLLGRHNEEWVERMFQIGQSFTCNCCKTVSVDAECQYILDLSSNVEGENSVNDLLSHPKSCDLHCSKCDKITPHSTRIVELPKVLILLLGHSGSVRFDPRLDMQPFMANPQQNNGYQYKLKAVIRHIGINIDRGHFISYVEHEDSEWFRISDERVTVIQMSSVLRYQPYMLAYER